MATSAIDKADDTFITLILLPPLLTSAVVVLPSVVVVVEMVVVLLLMGNFDFSSSSPRRAIISRSRSPSRSPSPVVMVNEMLEGLTPPRGSCRGSLGLVPSCCGSVSGDSCGPCGGGGSGDS